MKPCFASIILITFLLGACSPVSKTLEPVSALAGTEQFAESFTPSAIASLAATPLATASATATATETAVPTATRTMTPTPISWQWLPYDPRVWQPNGFDTLHLKADPACKIWFDYGSDYPHDWSTTRTPIEIGGHPWIRWVFVDPKDGIVGEHYGPEVERFFGWYHIPASQECRLRLLELLEQFPWDVKITPLWPPTETPRQLSSEQAVRATEYVAWINANATIQHITLTAQTAISAQTATEAALMLTPPVPYQVCEGGILSRLRVGMRAYVSTDTPYPNAVRQSPTKKAALLVEIEPGTVIELISGPTCADELTWWEVRLPDGQTGWTAEGKSDAYWLTPCPMSGACP